MTFSQLGNIPSWVLVRAPGGAGGELARRSHFTEPVENDKRLRGSSRRWGDVPLRTQRIIIRRILQQSQTGGLNCGQAAFVLALIRSESGFNPDAAARQSSASGLGQFIDRTGGAYGLHAGNRFQVDAGIAAVLRHLSDLMAALRQQPQKQKETWEVEMYRRYHDGPTGVGAGAKIARELVLPWSRRIAAWLCREN